MLSLCMAILILMYILKGLPEALTFFYSEISNSRSRIPSIKQFQVIQREVLLSPDEINDMYIDINNDLQMNINVYNGLISNA